MARTSLEIVAMLISALIVSSQLLGMNVSSQDVVFVTASEPSSPNYSTRVDKRIELLTAVQLFTSWKETGIWKEDYPYKQEMWEFFESYSKHEAVTICQKLITYGFSYDAPVGLMFHLSDPPELNVAIPFSDYLIGRAVGAGGATVLEQFVKALRDFWTASKFEDFWQSHQAFYDDVEKRASEDISLESVVETLEDYFGMRQHSYNVILAPAFLGNYGPRVKVNGSFDVYSVLCPMRIEGNAPVFGGAVIHEFAHSFVNPLTDEFLGEFRDPERLYRPIAAKTAAMAYGNWVTMINEHIIRAVEIRLFNRTGELNLEETRGFIYIKPVFNLLSKYDRERYESFRAFYPEIVTLFNELEPPTPFIETPLGIATVSSVAIVIMILVFILLKKRLRK